MVDRNLILNEAIELITEEKKTNRSILPYFLEIPIK